MNGRRRTSKKDNRTDGEKAIAALERMANAFEVMAHAQRERADVATAQFNWSKRLADTLWPLVMREAGLQGTRSATCKQANSA